MKDLLGINDDSQDNNLAFIISNVDEIIRNYCNIEEVPFELTNTAYRMAMDLYRYENIGSEEADTGAVSSMQEGDTTVSFRHNDSFRDTVLKDYKQSLNRFRKVAFK